MKSVIRKPFWGIINSIGNGKEPLGMEREILLLGDPSLYEISEPVLREELEGLRPGMSVVIK